MSKNKLKRVNYSSPQPTYISKQRAATPGRVLNVKSIAATNFNIMIALAVFVILRNIIGSLMAGGLGILWLAIILPFSGLVGTVYLFPDFMSKACIERFYFSRKKIFLVGSIIGALLGMALMTSFLVSQTNDKVTSLVLLAVFVLKLGVIIEAIVLFFKKEKKEV